jgi:choline-sulfatase
MNLKRPQKCGFRSITMKKVSFIIVFFSLILLSTAQEKPFKNIVCIIGDDHAATVLGCYGNPVIKTPNLDNLASRGLMFTQAYSNAPLCSASRQSILTGKLPHACGVTLLRTSFPQEEVTIAEHLLQHGFATAVVGKTHFNNAFSHGFDQHITKLHYSNYIKAIPESDWLYQGEARPKWRPFQDQARIWLNADGLPSKYNDAHDTGTYFARESVNFIKSNQKNRFCLWVGFGEPHSPFNFPHEYAGIYQRQDMPLPEGSPEDDRWLPLIFKDLSETDKRGIIASYYSSVTYLDKNVGLIIQGLEETGLLEETLVIYMGDQGYLLGDHKRFEKHMMWEEAVRAPLIICAGGKYGKGRKIDVLTEFIDLAPTILDLLNIPPMEQIQGKSLYPVITGEKDTHKEYVFAEFLVDNKAMVRNREWKCIFTSGKRDLGQGYATGNPPSGIRHRLYNLIADPKETRDVAGLSENREILIKLQSALLQRFMDTDPRASSLPEGLTTVDALVFFCDPPDKGADLEAK